MSEDGASASTRSWLGRAALRGRFAVLFWLLVVVISVPVVVPDGPLIRRIMAVTLFIVMLSGLNAISNRRREFAAGIILAVPAVALSWISLALGNLTLYVVSEYVYLAFFVYLAVQILRWTLQQHEVDLETIYGAVSVYLLMALVWGIGYYTIALTNPGSFHFPDGDQLGQVQSARASLDREASGAVLEDWTDIAESAQGTMMYYSFVTLTTLGYGDIYPTGDATRILAMLEATLGQLYLVILVARLVGLYTAQESERRSRATPT